MATIGTVFVNVLPQTAGFAQRLRGELSRVNEEVRVRAEPDMSGFQQRLRTELGHITEKVRVEVEPDTSGFRQRLRAGLGPVNENIKINVVPDTTGFRARVRAETSRLTDRVRIKVEPDTSGFKAKLQSDLASVVRDLKIKVAPDTSGFKASLRAALGTVGMDLTINVVPDFRGFRDAVRLELRWIETHERLKIQVNADSDHLRAEVTAAIARAQLGQRIIIPINAGGPSGGAGGAAGAAGSGITGILGGLSGVPAAGMAAAYAAAGVAVTGLTGAVVALGSALAPVAGLMGGAALAGAVGMGQAFAALAIPLKGVTGAVKALSTAQQDLAADGKISAANQEKLKEAMQQLSPAAQQLVRTIFSLQPAWVGLQKATQQALFPGVNDALQAMIKTLPNLQQVLVETSGVFGDLARRFGQMFASPLWQRDIQIVGMANATTLANLGTAGLNLLDVFRNLSAAAAPFVLYLSHMVAGLTETWKAQIETARTTGTLNAFFRQGYETLLQLGRIAGNVFSGLWAIVKQGMGPGRDLLTLIEQWSAKFKEWANTARAQSQINDFFRASAVIFKAAALAIGGVGAALLSVVTALGRFAPQISQVGGVLQSTVNPAFTALSTVARTTLGPALAAIGTVVLRDVAPAMASLVNALGRGVAPALDGLGRAVRDSVAPALASMARTVTTVLAPALGDLAATVGTRLGQIFQEIGKTIRDHVAPAFESIAKLIRDVVVPVLKSVANVVADLAVVFLKTLGPAVDGLKLAFDGIRAVLTPLAGVIRDHKELVYLAAAAWLALNRAIVVGAVASILGAYAAAWNAIGAALRGIPALLTGFVAGIRSLGGGSMLLGAAALGGIALAITGVAHAIDAWANGAEQAKERIRGMTEEVRRSPGDIQAYRRALDNVNAAINSNMFTMKENAGVWDYVGKTAQVAAGLITGSTERDAIAIGQLRAEQRRLQEQQTNLLTNTTLLNAKYFGFRDVISGLAKTYNIDLSGSLQQADQNFRNAMATIEAGVPKTARLGGSIRELAGQEDKANTEADRFRNTLDLLFGRFMGYENAAINTADAIKEIGNAARDSGGRIATFNGLAWSGSDAQINLRKTLDRAFEGLQNQAEAYQKNGHSAEEAKKWLDEHVAALYRQALALGVNKNDLDAWARSMGLAPAKINEISSAANGMRQSLNNAGAAANGVKTSLFNAFSGAATWLRQKGLDIVGGLTAGIREGAAAAQRIVADAGRTIQNDFLSSFNPFGSPSRPMIQKGKDIAAGIQVGITEGTAGAVTAMTAAGTRILVPINAIPAAAATAGTRTGAALGSMASAMGTLATNTATRSGQIVASHGNMAGGAEGSARRVGAAFASEDKSVNNTQSNHATRMGQISSATNTMVSNVGTAVGRFIGELGRQDTKTNQTQANHATRSGQISNQANTMEKNVGSAVARFIGDLGRQDTKTNQTQANHATRSGQISNQAATMERNVGSAVARFIGDLGRQDTKTNQTQSNHSTRMGQIDRATTGMANTTGTQVARAIGSYQGMQRQVDSLHGKDFNVTSHASVILPAAQSIVASVNNIAASVRKLIGFREGGILRRQYADGGLNGRDLPSQAVIAPVRGAGLVQWAEPETGGEAFIPLAASKRNRSLEIWRETGRLLGAFAIGGWVNPKTSADMGTYSRDFQRFLDMTDSAVKSIGQASADTLAKMTGNLTSAKIAQALAFYAQSLLAPHGPGYSLSGSWASGILPWVNYIARTLNVSASTYGGSLPHHPAQSHAVDLAVGQAGMINTAPATGPSGNDLYSSIARWIDSNILAKPTPGWYVGTHAAIHTRGGAWHPASSQVGKRGQTFAHDDHVHLSFDPRYDGAPFGIPSNYSQPGFSWNEGTGPPAVAANVGAAVGAAIGSMGGGRFTQAQMEAAMRAVGAPANVAHIFSAIGMAENPNSSPVVNQYGTFDSVWAIIRSYSQSKGYDINRLNTDLTYAASAAYNLYKTAGFDPWQAFTNGSYVKFMAEGGILDRLTATVSRLIPGRRRKKVLSPEDEDWGDQAKLYKGVPGTLRRFDSGGYLQPGVTLAENRTSRPEKVVSPAQEDQTVSLLRQLTMLIGEQNMLLRRMPGAQADALNTVAYRAILG